MKCELCGGRAFSAMRKPVLCPNCYMEIAPKVHATDEYKGKLQIVEYAEDDCGRTFIKLARRFVKEAKAGQHNVD